MPRGKKAVNFEEELSRIDARILHHQNSIKELEEKKTLLFAQREEAELKELLSVVKSAGKTPKELMELIQKA